MFSVCEAFRPRALGLYLKFRGEMWRYGPVMGPIALEFQGFGLRVQESGVQKLCELHCHDVYLLIHNA